MVNLPFSTCFNVFFLIFLLYNVRILFIFILVFILSYIFITIDQNLHGGGNSIVFKFFLEILWCFRKVADLFRAFLMYLIGKNHTIFYGRFNDSNKTLVHIFVF